MKEKYILKKPLNRWLVFAIGVILGLSLGFQLAYKSISLRESALVYSPITVPIEVQYLGNHGVTVWGNYTINLPDNGGTSELKNFEAKLPYTIWLNIRPDAHIAANATTVSNQNLKIKIYRNGVECKYDDIKGYEPGKSCSPPRI